MQSLNYLHLYYFWIAAQERGFLKASKRLGVSQSTVSTQILNLEKQLDCRLITRGPRKFELTDEGKKTFYSCESIFRQGEGLLHSLKTGGQPKISLRFGFENHLSTAIRKSILQPLMGLERISIRVEIGQGDELLRKIHDRQLDVVYGNTRPSQNAARGIKSKAVMSSNGVLVGKRKWRKKESHGPPFKTAPLFLPPASSPLREAFQSWSKKFSNFHVDISVETEDESLLKSLAIDGQGLSLLSKKEVQDEIRSGELIVFHEFRDRGQDYFLTYQLELETKKELADLFRKH